MTQSLNEVRDNPTYKKFCQVWECEPYVYVEGYEEAKAKESIILPFDGEKNPEKLNLNLTAFFSPVMWQNFIPHSKGLKLRNIKKILRDFNDVSYIPNKSYSEIMCTIGLIGEYMGDKKIIKKTKIVLDKDVYKLCIDNYLYRVLPHSEERGRKVYLSFGDLSKIRMWIHSMRPRIDSPKSSFIYALP